MGTVRIPMGRARELAVLDGLLDRVRAGGSGALLLRGDPGIGKTAVLEYAVARADGVRVLRVAAAEAEATLPFAALHLLLRPALARVGRLPGPQRRAIEAAFGPRAAAPAERLLVGVATLSLLAELAADGPLLCVVDDAQWLDGASADALAFAARRLDAEGVLLLAAARDTGVPSPLDGLDELRLGGLGEAESAALLDERGGDLPGTVRARILAEAGGNPLALRELPTAPSADLVPQAPLPLTDRLLRAFHDRFSRLPDATRSLLLVVAADGTGDLDTVLRAAGALGDPGGHANGRTNTGAGGVDVGDLSRAQEAGLLRVTDGRVTFRYPLLRAAVYQCAPLAERHAAHRALAAALTDPVDADRRAWHRAAATVGLDEDVAAELERSAVRAGERTGCAAAAAAYERAARLTGDPAATGRRLTLAAEAAAEAGLPEQARALAEEATGHVDDPGLRVRSIRVRADAAIGRGDFRRAYTLLMEGADTDGDLGRTVALLAEAARAAGLAADHEAAAAVAARLDDLAANTTSPVIAAPDTTALGSAALDTTALVTAATSNAAPGNTTSDTTAPETATSDAATLGTSRWLAALAAGRPVPCLPPPPDLAAADRHREPDDRDLLAGVLTGQDGPVLGLAVALAAEHRARGRIGSLPAVLCHAAEAELNLGRPHDARVHAAEALDLARECGQRPWVAHATGLIAYLAALTGDEAACRESAEAALASALPSATALATSALGLRDLARGSAESALARLETLPDGPATAVRGGGDLVEAAVRLGAPHRAATALTTLEHWAGHVRRAPYDALLARCRALLGPDADAGGHFVAALRHHDRDGRPFERARTELLYGEWLRRMRHKSEARDRLRAAQETFERIGAAPWARRAARELGATGIVARTSAATRRLGVLARLTPQELQIVRLAGEGLTNRDIAARLFLSPRTVAYHLYKAYPKLDVSSRKELAALPLE